MPRTKKTTHPPCPCTTTHRCPVAHQLRAQHAQGRHTRDPVLQTTAWQAYHAHLRAARVRPGQAQWED